ncbi:E3 binding domain-containing protein [Kaistia adipata]|uniref:E3 binding domain-containing protein n=1 Tax=Kaistia adipata TaxID=166954 RepID=UPI000422BD74|nr:E3 binding domain-containing protein [Kaistia adipata]
MNAPLRTLASPYARRLARERGIPLSLVAGSGPNGRIVAGDVPLTAAVAVAPGPAPAVEVAAPAPAAAPVVAAAPARSISAFSATVELGPLAEFVAASGAELPIDAFLVKAAARAAGTKADAVRWIKPEGGGVTIPRAVALAPTEIARLLAGDANAGASGKALVLSRLTTKGIRPVAGSLPADADLRFLVVASDDAATAEVLLVHDAEVIPEGDATEILAGFRDLIEAPLRLLV